MPDITMCHGDSCAKKLECYRHRANPTSERQSYFQTPPVKADGSCYYFLPMHKDDGRGGE